MTAIQSMESGKVIEKGGVYCCLYHQKNKLKLKSGSTLPTCNFAGLKCGGYWHLIKEIHEKTREEIHEMRNRQKVNQNKRKGLDKTFTRKLHDKKFNKWDFEKW